VGVVRNMRGAKAQKMKIIKVTITDIL